MLFEPLFDALNAGHVRYVVVGGLATVLHDFARLTADVALAVDLEPAEARRAIEALTGLGMRPRAPVAALDFADETTRQSWVRDKGMRVFSLWDPKEPMREVDLFVEHPIAFDELFARSEVIEVNATAIRIASIRDRCDGDRGDWESNRKRKLTRGLDATPAQRLAWLEEAIRLAYASGALPRRRADDPTRPPRG